MVARRPSNRQVTRKMRVPDVSAFFAKGDTAILSWGGDRPEGPVGETGCSGGCGGKSRVDYGESPRPDMSMFVQGSTDFISWGGDSPFRNDSGWTRRPRVRENGPVEMEAFPEDCGCDAAGSECGCDEVQTIGDGCEPPSGDDAYACRESGSARTTGTDAGRCSDDPEPTQFDAPIGPPKIPQSVPAPGSDGDDDADIRDFLGINFGKTLSPCDDYTDVCGDAPIGVQRHEVEQNHSSEGFEFIDNTEGQDWTYCEQKLMEAVIGFLRDNVDLVDWAVCMATGSRASGGCLRNIIEGNGLDGAPVPIFKESWPFCSYGMITTTLDDGRLAIGVCSSPKVWTKWGPAANLYCDSDDPYADDCAIIAMAGSFLHELSHLCGYQHLKNGPPFGRCTVPYLLGNAFTWAAFQRYPFAMTHPCCAPFSTLQSVGDRPLPVLQVGCVPLGYPGPVPGTYGTPWDGGTFVFVPGFGLRPPGRAEVFGSAIHRVVPEENWTIVLDGAVVSWNI